MAEVYLAHDEVLGRDVALKVLRGKYAKNEEFVGRFRREARSAASLNHPNIVPVYDRGRSEDGTYYMAMEYLPGGTLKDRVLGEGPLSPNAAVELGYQVARALGHAHEHGVIHRDVKPQNVLLTGAGYAKVTDFGIAKAATATTTTSSSGLILGTAGYMSPEQATGKPVDPRSDLYSLGVVLYEMLTGTLPHRGEDPASVSFKHGDEAPPSPREANPDVPEPLDALTTKLLAEDPEDRYPSAVELADDLERMRPGLPPLAAGTKETQKVGASLLSTGEKRAKRTANRPPAAAPMEVFGSATRRGGRLFRILVMLLFGVTLFGGLAWALTQDHGAPETSASEDAPGKEERSPSAARVPSGAPETSGPEDAPGGEEAAPSAMRISDSVPEAAGSEGAPSGEERAPSTAQVPSGAPETSGSEEAPRGEEAKPPIVRVPKTYYASEAEGALTDAGLKLGDRTDAPSDTVPAGGVIEQDPAAGATAEEGTAVDVVVSTGPKQEAPAAEQSAPAADVSAGSRQAPAAQTSSTITRAVSASSVHDETVRKKKEKK